MICALHALIGAALGKPQPKPQAFLTGVLSHLFADLVPHRDLTPGIETLMVLAALGGIGATQGWNSSAFWGALGAVLPDVENGLAHWRGQGRLLFPTHRGRHGAEVEELYSQIGIALVCLAVIIGPDSSKSPPA
jgi:hypothetical protein